MTRAKAIEILNIGYDGCVKFRETVRGNSDEFDYLNDLLIALLTAIDALEQNPGVEEEHDNGWISVKDRMPEEGVEVLIYGNIYFANRKSIDIDYVGKSGDFFYFDKGKVTHWQPLPEPPESAEITGGK